jgi:hypothetical protein
MLFKTRKRTKGRDKMQPLLIKRRLETNDDPKQLLRAQVEQWPIEKQREFVEAAFQLLGDRIDLSKIGHASKSKYLS